MPTVFPHLTKLLQRKEFYTLKPQTNFVVTLLSTSFLLCENFKQASSESSFTASVIELTIQIAALSTCPPTITTAILRGFDQLLTSFVLSIKQREKISNFVNEKLSKASPTHFFLLTGLMITCMYTSTDGQINENVNIENEKSSSYMENFERIKILFIKFRESAGKKKKFK